MTSVRVRYAVEGATDAPVAEKLLTNAGFCPVHTLTAHGKAKLDPKLPGLNKAAAGTPWLVLRDVDHDDAGSCVPDLLGALLKGDPLSPRMCLRLAVRAVEAWLLADHEAFAEYFGIRRRLPDDPEQEPDPKATVVNLCRKSGKPRIREGMVPRPGGRRSVGPEYVALIQDYAASAWDPERARLAAASLHRAMNSLERMKERLS